MTIWGTRVGFDGNQWRVFNPITSGVMTGCPLGVGTSQNTKVGMD